MNKIEKLNKFLKEAKDFLGKNLTCSDSRFEAWNNSLLRFIKANYDTDTYELFKYRRYSIGALTFNTPKSDFVEAFESGIESTIEELKIMIEEEEENIDSLENLQKDKTDNYSIDVIMNICKKFNLVCKELRHRHDDRATLDVEDEYDVQDLFHSLLHLYFDGIRPEEYTPSYAGSCSRQDFLLKDKKVVIETKMMRKSLTEKVVGEQLIVDIERYKQHQDCKYLICFIYDPESRISNPRGMERDLTKSTDGIKVITIINQG